MLGLVLRGSITLASLRWSVARVGLRWSVARVGLRWSMTLAGLRGSVAGWSSRVGRWLVSAGQLLGWCSAGLFRAGLPRVSDAGSAPWASGESRAPAGENACGTSLKNADRIFNV